MTAAARLLLWPLTGLRAGEVAPGCDLAAVLNDLATGEQSSAALAEWDPGLRPGDVVVLAAEAVARAEARGDPAKGGADRGGANGSGVQVASGPARIRRTLRRRGSLAVVELADGVITGRAGTSTTDHFMGWPRDPDRSARRLADQLRFRFDVPVAVVVADGIGRPWRRGDVGAALGCAGLRPVVAGQALADEIAGAARLLLGTSGAAAALVRGAPASWLGPGSASHDLVRPAARCWFR